MGEEESERAEGVASEFIRSPAAMAAGITSGTLAVSAILQPGRITELSLCPIFHLTGIECPFCGMTRSFVSITHGDISGAIDYNPGSPLIYAAFMWLLYASIRDLRMKQYDRFPETPRWLLRSWLLVTIPIFAWLLWSRLLGGLL